MVTRRNLLKWASASAVAVGLRPLTRQRVAYAATIGKPRFFLHLIPSGGTDPIYWGDPRTSKEVDKGIDVPYASKDIVTTARTRLGPGFAALAPHIDRIAVINGVRQNSANHHSGLVHVTCMRSTSMPATPTLFDVLGSRRTQEATGAVSMGLSYATAFSPKFLGVPSDEHFGSHPGVFDHLDLAAPDELRVAARALRREAASLGAQPAESTTSTNLQDSAALFDGWAKAPKFALADWSLEMESQMFAGRDVQRALWMFENGLTRCATVMFGMFDSHLRNHHHQSRKVPYVGELVARLLGELDRRIVDGRPMSEQTVVIVGSEIGRFPRLNVGGGKDHFSQGSWLVAGPWFSTGTSYGATNRELLSQPVALDSGKASKGGHLLSVDDIGTMLMTLDGANPGLYGYSGERLKFVMR